MQARGSKAEGQVGILARETVTSATAAAIRERIMSGTYAAGQNLRQDALAAELGVSRIPIREAFRQLEAEGLVTLQPHRGAVVSTLSLAEVGELFDLRALIEPDLLWRAIPAMRETDLNAAAMVLEDYDRALGDAADIRLWGEMNSRFHIELYRPAGRERSLAMVRGLLANTDRYTRLQLVLTPRGTERARQEHQELLTLARRGAADAGAQRLRAHILAARDDLMKFVEEKG